MYTGPTFATSRMDLSVLLNHEECGKEILTRVVVKEERKYMVCGKNACEECGVTFKSKGAYLYHMYQYHGESSMSICETCKFGFRWRSELTKHLQCVHEKVKNFDCSFCDSGFYFRKDLVKHISSVHEKKRPFQCTLCGFRFGKREHMTRHVKTMHSQFDDGSQTSDITTP